MCPEAYEGSPIVILQNGDTVEIDIDNLELSILISEEDLKKRLRSWNQASPKIKFGYLDAYRKNIVSAKYGAYES